MTVPTVLIPGPAAAPHGLVAADHAAREPARVAVKLGAVRPKARKAVPRFEAYLDPAAAAAAPPPAAVDYYTAAGACLARMFLNDRYGDCVIAGEAHLHGVFTAGDTGTPAVATDQEVLANYDRLKAGPGDSGCVITDVLDAKKAGRFVAGGGPARIDGYVSVDPGNPLAARVATYLFGGLTAGLDLPAGWADAARPGFVWDAGNAAGGVVGGHEVVVVGYDEAGVKVSTWGMVGTLTWDGLACGAVTELYAQLAPAWYGTDRVARANGFDAATLAADLQKFGGGAIPDPAPPAPVPPPPPAPAGVLDLTLTGAVPAGLFGGSRLVTLTGTARPHAPGRAADPAGWPAVDWLLVAGDAAALAAAVFRHDPAGIADGLLKLLADLGVSAARAEGFAGGPGSIRWLSVLLDLRAVAAAVWGKNPAALVAALERLAADVGFPLAA